MDDSCDDLTIPDDWLDAKLPQESFSLDSNSGVSYLKRSHTEEVRENGDSHCNGIQHMKKQKLDCETMCYEKESSMKSNGTHSEAESLHHPPARENYESTQEDESLNEPNSLISGLNREETTRQEDESLKEPNSVISHLNHDETVVINDNEPRNGRVVSRLAYLFSSESETSSVDQSTPTDVDFNELDGNSENLTAMTSSDGERTEKNGQSASNFQETETGFAPDKHSSVSVPNGNLSENETIVVSNPGSISAFSRASVKNVETNGKEVEASSNANMSPLEKALSIQRDAKIIAAIVPDENYNVIYNKLLQHRNKTNRLDIVTTELLDSGSRNTLTGRAPQVQTQQTRDIFEEVELVLQEVPDADGNEVYTVLESLPSASTTRIKDAVTQLTLALLEKRVGVDNEPPRLRKKESSFIDDPILQQDPLFRDMREIARMFPEKDRNEIYAMLEAHYGKTNRMQAVINELLRAARGSQGEDKSSLASAGEPSQEETGLVKDKMLPIVPPVFSSDLTWHEVESLRTVFPDCDPNHLYDRLHGLRGQPDRSDILAEELFKDRNYPKLKDMELKKKKSTNHLTITVENFLEKFPEPDTTFLDEKKEVSSLYRQHAEAAMRNDFPVLKSGYVRKVLEKHSWHLLPAYQEAAQTLVDVPIRERRRHNKFIKKPRAVMMPMPEESDEYFFHELWYAHHELTVKDYKQEKVKERQRKLDEAKEKGELYECCCCYDDECLFEDLASCAEGHLFCKVCVLRSTEAAFGELKNRFPCLTGECDQEIPLSTLQAIIPATLFSKIVSRLQEEQVQQANIPDLVVCPFCPFATIMPDHNDKVFKCLNPECLKESCRLCQEPNHIPLRCEEVEKSAETKMRTYIENAISDAVMRKCYKCGKRFVKDSGCNKMTCICGATSCYCCKKDNIDYDHFNNNKKCANTDPKLIHQRDMEAAALKAKNQYLLDHPEAAELELKNDVNDLIKDYKVTGHGTIFDASYDDDNDENSSDDSSDNDSDSNSDEEYESD